MLEFTVQQGNNYDGFTSIQTTFVTNQFMTAHPASLRQRLTEINVYFSKNKCNTYGLFALHCAYFLMADEAYRNLALSITTLNLAEIHLKASENAICTEI